MIKIFSRKSLSALCVLLVLLSAAIPASAQKSGRRNNTYMKYIRIFSNEAIRQMKQHRIPASITMAQGLLETGAGTSSLAVEHNNHFGIKCHRTWKGNRTYRDDDLKGECFRSYRRWEDSYNDHSEFLKQKRYSSLFSLDKYDYKGWARGLQRCGYATDRGYANRLIKIIEDYELYSLDKGKYPAWMGGEIASVKLPKEKKKNRQVSEKPPREAYFSYGLLYVLAIEGDTYGSVAEAMGMKPHKVAAYNDAPEDMALNAGEVVYLQKKLNRAVEPYYTYVVRVGDSMHSISQKFGIKLEKLYKLNDKDEEYLPLEGDVLRLR